MEEFWIQLLAILTLLTPTPSASDTTEIRAVGGSVTFRSDDTDGNVALWSFGNVPIVTVAFGNTSEPIFHQDEDKTRFAVSEGGRALSISQLRMEDAGTYSVTINRKTSTFTLLVYKKLPEPTVSCETQNCSGGICSFSLRCSVTGAGFGNVSYNWTRWDELRDEGSVVVLAVNKSWQDPLTCTARNAVSSRNVTVTTPGGLCSENSARRPGPGASSGSGFGVGLVAVAVVVAVILLVLLVFFCKSRGWRKFHLSQSHPTDTATTPEYTTVYAEVGPSQQRIPNGIKPKPPGGESSTTIYSLVKRPEKVENVTVTGLELV